MYSSDCFAVLGDGDVFACGCCWLTGRTAGRRDRADAFCYSNDGGLIWRLLVFFAGAWAALHQTVSAVCACFMLSLSLWLRVSRVLLAGYALSQLTIFKFCFIRR